MQQPSHRWAPSMHTPREAMTGPHAAPGAGDDAPGPGVTPVPGQVTVMVHVPV